MGALSTGRARYRNALQNSRADGQPRLVRFSILAAGWQHQELVHLVVEGDLWVGDGGSDAPELGDRHPSVVQPNGPIRVANTEPLDPARNFEIDLDLTERRGHLLRRTTSGVQVWLNL